MRVATGLAAAAIALAACGGEPAKPVEPVAERARYGAGDSKRRTQR